MVNIPQYYLVKRLTTLKSNALINVSFSLLFSLTTIVLLLLTIILPAVWSNSYNVTQQNLEDLNNIIITSYCFIGITFLVNLISSFIILSNVSLLASTKSRNRVLYIVLSIILFFCFLGANVIILFIIYKFVDSEIYDIKNYDIDYQKSYQSFKKQEQMELERIHQEYEQSLQELREQEEYENNYSEDNQVRKPTNRSRSDY